MPWALFVHAHGFLILIMPPPPLNQNRSPSDWSLKRLFACLFAKFNFLSPHHFPLSLLLLCRQISRWCSCRGAKWNGFWSTIYSTCVFHCCCSPRDCCSPDCLHCCTVSVCCMLILCAHTHMHIYVYRWDWK